MKKTLFLTLVLAAICIMPSCKKEPAKSITFGDAKKMTIINYDKMVGLGETFNLDVDKDGNDDLSIQSYYDGPEVVGELQTLYLNCLSENIELLGKVVEKESYMHFDTTYQTSWDGSVTLVTYLSMYNTCEMVSENDVVYSSNKFVLSSNEENDPFNIDDYFQSVKVALFRENLFGDGECQEGNDTTYFWAQEYIYDCENFPTETEKFIGFKLTKDGVPHLGWLKINLIGNKTVLVHLLETAIQE